MPIKIKSTSGSVTLDAQNVAGDQTLTVPSIAGGKTLLTTDGDGSNLTGVLSFGGDTFGADKTIGSNDNYALSFETNATERLKITSDGRGLSQFTAKAWVNINAGSNINDSHNVSSVTDNGTGEYTANFSNNMANANYSVNVSAKGHNNAYCRATEIKIPPTTSACSVKVFQMNHINSYTIDAVTYIQVFGD